jgi:cytoskeletal protein CcmA (bactofilin family)
MALWAVFALTGATTALLSAPVAPALFELYKRRDATPLPTSRHDGKIANFAEGFSSRLEVLRPQLEACSLRGEIAPAHPDDTDVLLVGRNHFEIAPESTRELKAVMCSGSANIPAGQVVDADVHADSILCLQPNAVLRAGMSGEDVLLDPGSTVLRWLHARGSVHLRHGSTAYGRLSAEQFIHIEPGCVFQRMRAPHIHTVESDGLCLASGAHCECIFQHSKCHICEIEVHHEPEPGSSHDVFAIHRRRIRQEGDFLLPAHQTLNGNVVATGIVRFGPHSRFMGSTKSYKDTFVEEGACIHGSFACGGTLYLGEHSSVTGPVMAEQDVVIASGARVGRPDALTTIAARNIKIATGCELHGTIWARVRGIVENSNGPGWWSS